MKSNYFELIKKIREEKGFTQNQIAEKLDIARTTYVSFEQGKTELKFGQVVDLMSILGISWAQVESGMKSDFDKYKQMILAYLRLASDKDGKLLKTKLAKMLYLADFAWFYENLKSMSGMVYRRLPYGPVSNTYFRILDELEKEGDIKIDHKNEMFLISESEGAKQKELNKLSQKEKLLISKIAKKWKKRNTRDIVSFTHNQLPYKLCQPEEVIPYELIIQQDPEYVF